ncbi:hypothetical protein [Rhodophyticola sp. CCM32]|uniref:hypothetical protein n=1 Tax=Rhodophyticola sp. CCM32 TaxID=2916397 RepID=UPI00143D4024|nr:hypothetical protein [Rhodophyticola sp. CCM32]
MSVSFDCGSRKFLLNERPQNSSSPARPVFFGYLLCAVVTSILLLGLLALVFLHYVDISFLSEASCRHIDATGNRSAYTYCFYGEDWDESTYLSAVSGFYSTVIGFLVAVQALVSTLAFVFVRSTNRRAIEDEVEIQLPAYFGTTKAASEIEVVVGQVSGTAIEQAVVQRTTELQDKLSTLEENFYGLQGEYEALRAVVAELNDEAPEETIEDDEPAAEGKIE